MTKSELIEHVARETGLSKGRAEMAVNAIFESMVDALVTGEGIEIRGFGSFAVRQYKAYEGRNPRTGAVVHVPPKRLPFFKVGKELRLRINRSTEQPDLGAAAGLTDTTVSGEPEGPQSPVAPTHRPASSVRTRSRRRDTQESEDSI